jgi:hypothetical protein
MAFRSPGSNPVQPTGVIGYKAADLSYDNRFLNKKIPTYAEWTQLTAPRGGAAALTRLEVQITDAVRDFANRETFNRASQDKFDYYEQLLNLYLLTDRWLSGQSPQSQTAAIRPHVQALFSAVVYRLCEFFGVSVNALPERLARAHQFKEMEYSHAGNHEYMIRDPRELEKYRLIIKSGVVTQWDDTRLRDEPVDTGSQHIGVPAGQGNDSPQACQYEAGYVLSLWDELYMAKHDMNFDRFHSQYMGLSHVGTSANRGGASLVACAGKMTIDNGRVTHVSNDSGHYRPGAHTLLRVIWKLAMGGVNLTPVEACVQDGNWLFRCSAADYLANPTGCISQANPRPAKIWGRYFDNGHAWVDR